MIELSFEVLVAGLVLIGGFIAWLINVTYTMASIKSTLETELRFLRQDMEAAKKNIVDHDRRIQRMEDGSHGVIGASS